MGGAVRGGAFLGWCCGWRGEGAASSCEFIDGVVGEGVVSWSTPGGE